MSEWFAQHIRITAFRPSVTGSLNTNLYNELTGLEPDLDERRGPGGHFRRRAGVIETRRTELIEQPGRVDFTFLSPADLAIASVSGDLTEARLGKLNVLEELDQAAQSLIRGHHDVTRIALGGLLFYECETREESYKVLQQLIPNFDMDPARTSDFVLQANRFRPLQSLPEIQVNRLGVWSGVQGLSVAGGVSVGPHAFWTQQVLDVNTDAVNTSPLPDARLGAVWSEMKAAFVELSAGLK